MDALEHTTSLSVESISRLADGVIAIDFRGAGESRLPVWAPGAHVGLVLGCGLERQYSLCGDTRDEGRWRIAVLREPDGRGGSEWLHTQLRAGHVLEAKGPHNNFALAPAKAYLFIAGGIGITPFLPMIRELEREGSPWRLLYGGRKRGSMAFLKELTRFGDKVEVRPEDEFGRLDIGGALAGLGEGGAIYCCGPEGLLAAVEEASAGLPEGALHVERFRPRAGALEGPAGGFVVELAKSGARCDVGPGETIIDALDRIGVHVPRSCGEGTCGTCLVRVLDGIPDHRDSFLMGKKRAANNAMCVCCSRSNTARIVIDL